ncbi:MAG: nicotinamide-nucleotide amidase [Crocinitomicaceae bacterium]|jgi:nicotinamide-nucleotide amidase
MKVELISVGDELLIGQTVNTNAAWIGAELSVRGGNVVFTTVIQDTEEAIIDSIDHAFKRVDVIIITGGLGPTKDDITKFTLCKYFDTELEIDQDVLKHVESFFRARGREMLEVNIQQAALPKACQILKNDVGTASGMWFEKDGKILVSLPGVPYEMKHLMSAHVFARLNERFLMKAIYHRTLKTQGIGESFLAERIADIEDDIRAHNISLAYLPSPGQVRLRITSEMSQEKKDQIENYLHQIEERLPRYVYGRDKIRLTEVVGKLLLNKGVTVGTVESCTGGALASEIVAVSGSSDYFLGSFVSYSYELKSSLVGVKMEDIVKEGAVSETVVLQMATGGRKTLGVDYCLAASGIAGPGGGTEDKPVGTVWIALATPDRVIAKKFLFGENRERNIRKTVLTALNLLRCELLELSK